VVEFDGEEPSTELVESLTAQFEEELELVELDMDELDGALLRELGFDTDSDDVMNDGSSAKLGVDAADHPAPWEITPSGGSGDRGSHGMPGVGGFGVKELPMIRCFADLKDVDEIELCLSDTRQPLPQEPNDLAVHEAVRCVLEEQGDDVVVLEVDEEHRHYASYVVIASGRSQRHLRAMGDRIVKEAKAKGAKTEGGFNRLEGRHDEFWMLVHLGYCVVHFFRPEAREYFNLEALWAPESSHLYDPNDPGNVG
jgi:ribosome-associated protein